MLLLYNSSEFMMSFILHWLAKLKDKQPTEEANKKSWKAKKLAQINKQLMTTYWRL